MFTRLVRAAAPFALLLAAPALGQSADPPVTPADLRRHIDQLASDAFQGRAPATEGERLTIAYISEQLRARGVEPAGENGGWFQPVRLVERVPGTNRTSWTGARRPVQIAADELILLGREASETIANAPVIFAGHGARLPDRGIDQLAGANFQGAVALILLQGPQGVPGFPSLAERMRTLSEAGAVAVIAIVDQSVPFPVVARTFARGTTRLDSTAVPRVAGAMPLAAAQRLIAAAGGNLERLLNDQPGSSFRSVALNATASIEGTTTVQRYTSNNVIGRLRGSGSTNQSLLYLAHWDHFGTCRPEGEADRICNGAVDNASGVAALIEIAGRLSRQPRPARDILFLATTAEETGLLGAEYFAAHPVVPAASIAAAVNLDTIAIHPAGEPVAVLGRGVPALDRVIDETVREMGRRLDGDDEANAFVQRQDGWKLTQVGIPSVMVGGSFSNMALLQAFLGGNYHQPADQPGPTLQLDGAAEDTSLMVALGRRLADPAVYQRPAPAAAASN
ncbi:M28 family peptidase [Sphingosinicella sp.]|uniref:M28 family peptidase n=1 Tax=Sphingosinicella sp. TaxID=1917971 RepID=UPI004037B1DD